MKPRGNPLAPPGQPDLRDGVTVRLRSLIEAGPDGDRAVVHRASRRRSVTDLLEQGDGAAARLR